MRRRDFLLAPLLGGGGRPGPARAAPLRWRERALIGFGTTLSIRAGHADAQRLERALDDAVATLREVEHQTSLFVRDGLVRRLNRDGVVESPGLHLVGVARAARRISALSAGAFDATIQPLWTAWDDAARRSGAPPDRAELEEARRHVDWRGLQAGDGVVRLARRGMAVTLNGIAQGWAADQVRAVLLRHGVHDALVDTGEWSGLGAAPDGGPWRLGLADPRTSGRVLATLRADGRAVACSSDAHYAFSDDHRHHHILDPRRGDSPTALAAVAVLAPSATLADGLTKVLFMGDAAAALAAARRFAVDAVVVDKAGRLSATRGLRLG